MVRWTVSKKRLSQRWIAYAWLLLNTVCWGAALIVVKPAFDVTTPFRFLFYRFALAIICSLPIFIHHHQQKKYNWSQLWKTIIPIELISTTLTLGLLYQGLARTTAIEASLIITTAPLFITAAGIIWLHEREEKNELFGAVVALLGTIMLTVIPAYNGYRTQGISLLGNFLVLGQNVAGAIGFILIKKHYRTIPKFLATTMSFYIGAVSFALLSWWETPNLSQLAAAMQRDLSTPSVWIAVSFMAIFGSIIGLTAYIKGQDQIEASEASLFNYLQPLVYLPLGILFLGEKVSLGQVAGLGLVLGGVVIAQARMRRRKSKN
jgi:drug/metabolite transporter (DMT)-like permease